MPYISRTPPDSPSARHSSRRLDRLSSVPCYGMLMPMPHDFWGTRRYVVKAALRLDHPTTFCRRLGLHSAAHTSPLYQGGTFLQWGPFMPGSECLLMRCSISLLGPVTIAHCWVLPARR